MEARDAVGPDAARADSRDDRGLILGAGHPHKTATRDIECREDSRAARADVLRHGRLTRRDLSLLIQHFDHHLNRDVVARLWARLVRWDVPRWRVLSLNHVP